jgi:hypothetical protein
MSGDAAVAAALRDIQASPLRPSSRSLGTRSSSARRRVGGYCFVPDCERVLVTEGATAGTSDWATRDSTTS